jgi:hypothetical protein
MRLLRRILPEALFWVLSQAVGRLRRLRGQRGWAIGRFRNGGRRPQRPAAGLGLWPTRRRRIKPGFAFSPRRPIAKTLPAIAKVEAGGPAEARRIARVAIELWPHQVWVEALPNGRRHRTKHDQCADPNGDRCERASRSAKARHLDTPSGRASCPKTRGQPLSRKPLDIWAGTSAGRSLMEVK